MRLWHYKLIPYLPHQQLLGQHRECCALRGKGWGKKHSTIDYVFNHSYLKLTFYHKLIMNEMMLRRHNVNMIWFKDTYRGNSIGYVNFQDLPNINYAIERINYDEHNNAYLKECLDNLKQKGITINMEKD